MAVAALLRPCFASCLPHCATPRLQTHSPKKALDFSRRETHCFTNVTELEHLLDIKAEIDQKSLELELLRLEQETADIAHPFYLRQKCDALQAMNGHLEAVLKEKRSLRQRLAKPQCQESLPIEATYHRDVVELLTLAMTFVEKLEEYLKTVRTIPKIDECMRNMDNSLVKMETLETELEEQAEQIIKWRARQSEIQNGIFKLNLESIWSTTDMSSTCLSQESFSH
ncbi:HAUS augmin-like complex subunit 2 isoform X2 [Ambystoma mexicanum]|uniref:HAUS augmin-like complex subunit 2 isoform X2 n=1 Tax=Ambystoma mexicanum TaxID=8296 RepID=UPI0037E95C9B